MNVPIHNHCHGPDNSPRVTNVAVSAGLAVPVPLLLVLYPARVPLFEIVLVTFTPTHGGKVEEEGIT